MPTSWCRRRAAQRYTRNGALQINGAGQLVTIERRPGARHRRPDHVSEPDHDIVISRTGIITVREGSPPPTRRAARCSSASFASRSVLQKDGASTFMAPPGVTSTTPSPNTRIVQGAIEKSNVNGVAEMARMIEITRSYTDIATILQQQGDLRKNALSQLSQLPTS